VGVVPHPINANLVLNSLIVAFLVRETATIYQAMPAAGYAYANFGE
jgi:hypothetical protein